jgi:hypothetical protein
MGVTVGGWVAVETGGWGMVVGRGAQGRHHSNPTTNNNKRNPTTTFLSISTSCAFAQKKNFLWRQSPTAPCGQDFGY